MDDFLWDRDVMRVYCDCSVSKTLKAFGLAASFVFDGSVTVDSRKAYDRTMQLLPTSGELQALLYAMEQVKVMLNRVGNMPQSILVYSDVDHIERLLNSEYDGAFGTHARQISEAKASFDNNWPTVNLNIRYLPPEEQRHNPFYAAVHNAARKEVSIGRR